MSNNLSVVILAAGRGSRMKSPLPKVLHQVAGVPMIKHVIETAKKLSPNKIVVVCHHGANLVRETVADDSITWVYQPELNGTGGAVMCALPEIPEDDDVLILLGDTPLVSYGDLRDFWWSCHNYAFSVITNMVHDSRGYGRILRDEKTKDFIGIVEEKDATDEQKKINEINTGIMLASRTLLNTLLPKLNNNNAQGELYVTDCIDMVVELGLMCSGWRFHYSNRFFGVNTKEDLEVCEEHYKKYNRR